MRKTIYAHFSVRGAKQILKLVPTWQIKTPYRRKRLLMLKIYVIALPLNLAEGVLTTYKKSVFKPKAGEINPNT